MKLTKSKLREIIEEEIQQLNEVNPEWFRSKKDWPDNSKIVDDISDMVDDYGEFSKKLNMIDSNSLGSKFTTNLSAVYEFSNPTDVFWDKEVKNLKLLFSKVKSEILEVGRQRVKKTQQNIKKLDKLFSKLK